MSAPLMLLEDIKQMSHKDLGKKQLLSFKEKHSNFKQNMLYIYIKYLFNLLTAIIHSVDFISKVSVFNFSSEKIQSVRLPYK